MRIHNAQIESIDPCGSKEGAHFGVKVEFEGGCHHVFWLDQTIDFDRVLTMMDYAGVDFLMHLKGKSICIAESENALIAIGDPDEDKIVPIQGPEFREEITKEAFREEFERPES